MHEIFYTEWYACYIKCIQFSGGGLQDVELCDANLIIPKKDVFKHMGSYAAFADLFRWKLMYDTGGCYVDTDVLCLQRFDFKEDVVIAWENENLKSLQAFWPASTAYRKGEKYTKKFKSDNKTKREVVENILNKVIDVLNYISYNLGTINRVHTEV